MTPELLLRTLLLAVLGPAQWAMTSGRTTDSRRNAVVEKRVNSRSPTSRLGLRNQPERGAWSRMGVGLMNESRRKVQENTEGRSCG